MFGKFDPEMLAEKFPKAPIHLVYAIVRYGVFGLHPGSALEAVIKGDMNEFAKRADDETKAALDQIRELFAAVGIKTA